MNLFFLPLVFLFTLDTKRLECLRAGLTSPGGLGELKSGAGDQSSGLGSPPGAPLPSPPSSRSGSSSPMCPSLQSPGVSKTLNPAPQSQHKERKREGESVRVRVRESIWVFSWPITPRKSLLPHSKHFSLSISQCSLHSQFCC